MRSLRILWLGLLLPGTGCNLFWYAGHNLINEPRSRLDEFQVSRRLRVEAEQTWARVCREYGDRSFTREFADGFVEGYIDYLEHGGQSQPPTVPPPRYRRPAYLTPSGYERAKDYLIGFKYGADVALATGRRQFLTVPVLVPEPRSEPPLNINMVSDAEAIPVPPPASDSKPLGIPRVLEAPKPMATPTPTPTTPPKPDPKGLPEPKPMKADEPVKPISTMPLPEISIPSGPPLPPEVRPSGGPIPGVDDLIQAIDRGEPSPVPVSEAAELPLPIRGPRGFDARYLAPTLWLVNQDPASN